MAAIAVVHENERLHALDVEYRLTAVPRADSGAHCWHYLLWISGAAHQNFGGRSRSLRERHIRCRFRLTAEPVLDVAANANHRHPARSAFSQTDMLADGMSGRPVIPGHSFAEDHRRRSILSVLFRDRAALDNGESEGGEVPPRDRAHGGSRFAGLGLRPSLDVHGIGAAGGTRGAGRFDV